MSKVKKGWKVLSFYNTDVRGRKLLGSLFRKNSEGGIPYLENEWVTPYDGFGPLTILKTRKAARFLSKNLVNHKSFIRKCFYIPSKDDCVWSWKSICLSGRTDKRYSKYSIHELEKRNFSMLIPGQTVLASKVMILPETSHKKKYVM